jgi:asparagine synthase (glutamine-hydrolysing)
MCGIAGFVALTSRPVVNHARILEVMGNLIAHRGPDGRGSWVNEDLTVGLAHQRLAIIDLSDFAAQPMIDRAGRAISFNGEIYNYLELRGQHTSYSFETTSDTESILAVYDKLGVGTATALRGMFAFALWDPHRERLLLSRDRFGIKPLFYTTTDGVLYFASEAKALLPFVPTISTDPSALAEYLTFQYTIGEQTLFRGIKQLLPAHNLVVERGVLNVERYWDIAFDIDLDHHKRHFIERTRQLVNESVEIHLRSDVEVGAYVSGGIDSSLIGVLASKHKNYGMKAFHGRFLEYPGYDESIFAREVSEMMRSELFVSDITARDFIDNLRTVIFHLDFPIAGPGSFPQFMVSKHASDHVKVVLGGQGGDEIFGGYARYLIAYLEQCLKAAIDGTHKNGNFVVTLESIIPNLGLLREYKPLIQEFWKEGLFGSLDERFFRLVDRSTDMKSEIDWSALDMGLVKDKFLAIFNDRSNVAKEAYFDSMTHFEFKTLLPALLHVEDRMSMAHGLESRVPLLDHPLVEMAATVPADVKFPGGQLKHLLKTAFADSIPSTVLTRRDKMGFPVPLNEWMSGEAAVFMRDIFENIKHAEREYINADAVLENFTSSGRFSRKSWALMSLELWQQEYHDRASHYRHLLSS